MRKVGKKSLKYTKMHDKEALSVLIHPLTLLVVAEKEEMLALFKLKRNMAMVFFLHETGGRFFLSFL